MTDAADEAERSTPCVLCGYEAESVLGALVHLGGHIRGREHYETGAEQALAEEQS